MWGEDVFAAALRDRRAPVPEFVTSWTGPRPPRRFSVYRNNVRGALVEALAVRYPVVQRLVGEEFFRAMASEFALAHLPPSPVLISYGGEFPSFIEGFAPAASVPYLADVARLESAYWEAYHAADVSPLEASGFASIEPSRLAAARFDFISAFALVASRYPIVSIWRTNAEDEIAQPADLGRSEAALVARPGLEVEVRRLPEGAMCFLSRLQGGLTLGESVEAVLAETSSFDLTANLAGVISARIVAAIRI
jgi:hypothetical protein